MTIRKLQLDNTVHVKKNIHQDMDTKNENIFLINSIHILCKMLEQMFSVNSKKIMTFWQF